MKTKILFTSALLLLLNWFSTVYSCTTFCIYTNDELVFGKNYDWMIGNGIVFVNKKDVIKSAFGQQDNPAQWVSKYGSITFNQFGREFPMGGINEKGLVVELMWLDDTKYPDKDERSSVGGILQWIQFQLDNCQSVEEVISTDKFIRIPTNATPLHFLVADKDGNAASIEFLNGKLVYHTGGSMKFKVLTNDTYEKSIDYLKRHNKFGGAEDIQNSEGSLDRFVRACDMTMNYKKEQNESAVDYGFKILNNVNQSHTKWSIIYDIKNLKVYFKTSSSGNIKNIDLKNFDYSCSSPVMMIDINTNFTDNLNNFFTEYNYADNRELIEDSYNGVEFLKNIPDNQRTAAAKFPEELKCRTKSSNEENLILPEKNNTAIPIIIFTGIILSSVLIVLKKRN